jgi:predicted TIM-barrel fold metal-dependent hydrolase
VVAAQRSDGAPGRARRAVIDTGVRGAVESGPALVPYLPERWRRHLELFGARAPTGEDGPSDTLGGADPAGPGAGPDGVDRAILLPRSGVGRSNNLELDAALARAVNDWQVAEWLEGEPRRRGSIVLAHEDARLAVEEIERRAPDRRFVQVLLPGRSRAPLGSRAYWPIHEAAERHGLPLGLGGAGGGGYPSTGAGWPSFDLEARIGLAQAMQANLTSLVFNAVFERFPRLRVVVHGGGFAWAPPLLWRLDGSWKVLKDEAPELTRLPSEYVREQVYFATGPGEWPEEADRLLRLLEQLGWDDRVVFASGRPPGRSVAPDEALPRGLPEALEHRLLFANAEALYAERL